MDYIRVLYPSGDDSTTSPSQKKLVEALGIMYNFMVDVWRQKLEEEYARINNLLDPNIIALSQELDFWIVQQQRILLEKHEISA